MFLSLVISKACVRNFQDKRYKESMLQPLFTLLGFLPKLVSWDASSQS